jgi:hypothetical protein
MTGNGQMNGVVPLRQCNRKGCPKFGTRVIWLAVPYEAKSEREMAGLRVPIGLKLCEEHAKECRAADICTEEMKRGMIRAAIERGRPKLDFSRAMIETSALDDKRYLDFLENVPEHSGNE